MKIAKGSTVRLIAKRVQRGKENGIHKTVVATIERKTRIPFLEKNEVWIGTKDGSPSLSAQCAFF
jgi:hypothetical protein